MEEARFSNQLNKKKSEYTTGFFMFQGNAVISIDEKGRVIIPAKFRRHIPPEAKGIMNITLGRDGCLWLYPSNEWQNLLVLLSSVSSFTAKDKAMKRHILSHADECSIDSQHRILLNSNHLEKAGIKNEVLLIGQLELIELWNPKTYDKYLKSQKDSYEDVMEEVMTRIQSQKQG